MIVCKYSLKLQERRYKTLEPSELDAERGWRAPASPAPAWLLTGHPKTGRGSAGSASTALAVRQEGPGGRAQRAGAAAASCTLPRCCRCGRAGPVPGPATVPSSTSPCPGKPILCTVAPGGQGLWQGQGPPCLLTTVLANSTRFRSCVRPPLSRPGGHRGRQGISAGARQGCRAAAGMQLAAPQLYRTLRGTAVCSGAGAEAQPGGTRGGRCWGHAGTRAPGDMGRDPGTLSPGREARRSRADELQC